MNIRRAYKTELDPNAAQVSHFLRSAGAARWAWNQALAVNQRYYRETGVGLTYARMNRLLARNSSGSWLGCARSSTRWTPRTPRSCS